MQRKIQTFLLILFCVLILASLTAIYYYYPGLFTPSNIIIYFTVILAAQNIFTLIWMLFGWSRPEENEYKIDTNTILPAKHSFSILVPARHEERVIKDTISALSKINYPKQLLEIIILCRTDDTKTIQKAREGIGVVNANNFRLVLFDDYPINKPHALNIGLSKARGEIITIFDSEDEPHPEIFKIINTKFIETGTDIVQSGVQLMNFRSNWFSVFNVLEYYFWFKSGLLFFCKTTKAVPLAGNTVFIKKEKLIKIGGWDEQCLTEDAEVGIRLLLAKSKIEVIYDERFVTKEETPGTLKSFIRQRTRWDQGFIQIFFKGDWLRLKGIKQKLIFLYIFLSPFSQALIMVYIPLGVYFAYTGKLPLVIAFTSYLPFYLMAVHLAIYMAGIYKFTRGYGLKFNPQILLIILIYFYPYQIILAISAFRSFFRQFAGRTAWEKTLHLNGHRENSYA